MTVINKIMVAVDFSEDSLKAAQYGAKLAAGVGATLQLTNVYNQRDVDMMNKVAEAHPAFPVKKYLDDHTKERRERLEALTKQFHIESLETKINVRVGVPYEALLEQIEDSKPDMLVMGTKGRSNLVDMIVGSCAQKMFRRCPIPLLSIRGN